MARNSEKAQSMLYRFREQEAAEMGIIDIGRTRRPKVISSVDSIPVCEKWRGQVVKEIGRKVTKIQDPALSDYEIRDLNDEINKLMREKYVWEIQIRNLGGPNYIRFAAKQFDDEGRELPTTRGYKYFGRARELPGVKELLAPPQTAEETKQAKAEYRKDVDADYYGYRDEDDPELLKHEAQAEEISIGNTLKVEGGKPPEGWISIERPTSIPNRKEVEEWLVERRKKTLMEKYELES
ncbi:Isy1-like splicing factor [Lipomyces tetrasporus]|uniref:Pre-mRNA-splicing factor ISY1 n=1 Tax=Lipomyces tetrasporus TaxID=54092 RepID=A0AAD7VNR2_9ASCO|nr:Isy1-like splicing factor [Lipomyces tetrasporus]KAJ8096532.1 Isy1-like splicing factor [Lipomyces tetrasporus]